jgi:hypothetical protein
MINLTNDLLNSNFYKFKFLINNNYNYNNYLSKYFFIIIYNIINNNLNSILIKKYLQELINNGLNLYKIKNIKKTFLILKKNNHNELYEYLTLNYKKKKYHYKIINLLSLYKNSDGIIKEYFKNINGLYEMNLVIINKLNVVLRSFDDKKFLFMLKSLLITNNLNKNIIYEKEMLNRLKQLYLYFGKEVCENYNINIVKESEFLNFEYKKKLNYYDSCINTIICFNNIYHNDFYIYKNICKKIKLLDEEIDKIDFNEKMNIKNFKYNEELDLFLKNYINELIIKIEKKN